MHIGKRLLVVAALAVAGVSGPVLASGAGAATVSSSAASSPPADYVYEQWFGYGTACDEAGQAGIDAGDWIAYVCYDRVAGVEVHIRWTELYVKR